MFRKIKNKKAFTLIELTVIIVIITILSAIAYPRYMLLKENAPLAEVLENIEQIRAKQEYILIFEGAYTLSFTTLDTGIRGTVSGSNSEILTSDRFIYTLGSTNVTAERDNSMGYTITLNSFDTPTVTCSCPSPVQTDCTKTCNTFDNMAGN